MSIIPSDYDRGFNDGMMSGVPGAMASVEALKQKDDEIARLTARIAAMEWQPIDTAPYSTPVEVRVGSMTFLAQLEPDASLADDEQPCDQWQAVNEGEHPPCWSEGACWSSNSNEVMSRQPEAWRFARTTLEASEKK